MLMVINWFICRLLKAEVKGGLVPPEEPERKELQCPNCSVKAEVKVLPLEHHSVQSSSVKTEQGPKKNLRVKANGHEEALGLAEGDQAWKKPAKSTGSGKDIDQCVTIISRNVIRMMHFKFDYGHVRSGKEGKYPECVQEKKSSGSICAQGEHVQVSSRVAVRKCCFLTLTHLYFV